MVLEAIDELATGFEGCEKKLEIDFHVEDEKVDLRDIPRDALDSILNLARCTIISKQANRDFDAYVLSESSLFVYQSKIILKTCGTTLLLKCVSALLSAARSVGAHPDFLQFSRSNFLFPTKQHFPHRAFTEETDYLNEQLGIKGEAYILGSLNGARWHLYIWDFNEVESNEYQQQTLEIIMFNLNQNKMRTFYKRDVEEDHKGSHAHSSKQGEPTVDGVEATTVSGIDQLMPGARVDSHLFTPCGYSCNAVIDVADIKAMIDKHSTGVRQSPSHKRQSSANGQGSGAAGVIGKQGVDQQAYFTIHITPEPQCSFVSFETNAVLPNYTALVRAVVSTFQPGSFCVSLFVDGGSSVSDSRSGLAWEHPGYITKGTTHHAFEAGYNATVSQFEANPSQQIFLSPEYGHSVLNNEPVDSKKGTVTLPLNSPRSSPLSAHLVLNGLNGLPSSYQTVTSLSLEQMRAVALEVCKQKRIDLVQTEQEFSLTASSSESQPMTVQSIVDSILQSSAMSDESFTLIDLGSLIRRFYQWSQSYSRIEPVFAVHGAMVPAGMALVMSALGCHFTSHSTQAVQNLLSFGLPPSRLLLDIPIKSAQQIVYSHQQRVDVIVSGSVDDIKHIAAMHEQAEVLLAVKFDNTVQSLAFTVSEVDSALTAAKQLDVTVSGVILRVNEPATTIEQFKSYSTQLSQLYSAAAKAGHRFNLLHLGALLASSISSLSTEVMDVLKGQFDEDDVRVMADCRHFFDHASSHAVSKVRHVSNTDSDVVMANGHTESASKKRKVENGASGTVAARRVHVNDAVVAAINADTGATVTAVPAGTTETVDTLVAGLSDTGINASAALPAALSVGDWVRASVSFAGLEAATALGLDAPVSYYTLSSA